MTLLTALRRNRGLTLVEVILVMAALAVVGGIAIAIVNPRGREADRRNAQRQSDVLLILNAIYQYAGDNNGTLPNGMPTVSTEMCATGTAGCNGMVNLVTVAGQGKYMANVPKDPQCSTVCAVGGTGYRIQSVDRRITVSAPYAELGKVIVASR